MSLTSKLGNNARNVALAGLMGITGAQSLADVINIDVSWTYEQINNVMDGDPNTLGKDGQIDAVRGDTLSFANGIYQLPFDPNAAYRANIDGINILGQGPGITIFRGADPERGMVWEVKGEDVTLGFFSMENSRAGLKVSGDRTYENVYLSNIDSIDEKIDKHYIFDQQKGNGPMNVSSIYGDHLNARGGGIFVHWNEKGEPVDNRDKFMEVDNATVRAMGVAVDPPMITKGGQVLETLGTDWRNCQFIELESSWVPRAYEGMPGGRLGGNPPSNCGESGVINTVLYQFGNGNWVENDPSRFLDNQGRPIWGSIATGVHYRDRENNFVGYSGALPPRFPWISAKSRN